MESLKNTSRTTLLAAAILCGLLLGWPAAATAETTTPTAPAATQQAEPRSLAQWQAELGAPGTFTEPALATFDRPEFGLAAANTTEQPAYETKASNDWIGTAVWGLTALSLLLTLALAYHLGRSKADEDEKAGWKLTVGAKLSAVLGLQATLILLVSAMAINGIFEIDNKFKGYSTANAHKTHLDELELCVLSLRLNSQKYLRLYEDSYLISYTKYAGKADSLLTKLEQDLTDPQQQARLKSAHEQLALYDAAFVETVTASDIRNGILESQLNQTGPRLAKLLTAIKQTAAQDNDHAAAMVASETLSSLSLARIDVMKYLQSHDISDEKAALEDLAKAYSALERLDQEIQNPTRKKWVRETMAGLAFYSDRLEAMSQAIERSDDLVFNQLDVYGPQIAAAGEELIQELTVVTDQLKAENDATTASTMTWTLITSGFAILLAVAIATILIKQFTGTISALLGTVRAVAAGDLTAEPLNPRGSDELASLGRATDRMSESLRELIGEVRSSAEGVTQEATQIAAASEEISSGMTDQTSQVSQVSAAIEEMSSSVIEVARKSADASKAADDSGRMAESGGDTVRQTVDGMQAINDAVTDSSKSVQELGKRGEQIGAIIEVINDIADQTNLLALNAAIEAARAGEHGRGFAVVADEVRKLADRTTKATEEIGESIEAIQTETTAAVDKMGRGTAQVAEGVNQATAAGESLEKIVNASREVASMIQSIAAAAEQQSAAGEQVARSISSIQVITEESNKGAHQAAQAATTLASKAEQLNLLVTKFKLDKAG
ncbi:methyl-accepting chemotaxis protein [Mucisphaera sp.]|uniref:methyl-accepting chemotaxis protein n=1 Tax=Mucisphaera sp. TaxID=2913024 RepID=UPI003D097614